METGVEEELKERERVFEWSKPKEEGYDVHPELEF